MGRRSSKDGHGVEATPGFDTVGMTILPGHPLPEWAAEPDSTGPAGSVDAHPEARSLAELAAEAAAAAESLTEAAPAADELVAAQLVAAGVAAGAVAGAGVAGSAAAPQAGYAAPPTPQQYAPGAAPAMAGAAGYAAAAGHAPSTPVPPAAPLGAPPGYGPAGQAPAPGGAFPAGAYGAGTYAAPPTAAAPTGTPVPHVPAPGMPAPPQARTPGDLGQVPAAGAAMAAGYAAAHMQGAHAGPGHTPTAAPGAPGSQPDAAYAAQNSQAPQGTTMTATRPASDQTAPGSGAPGSPMDVAPSEGWTAPDRPELSPEHVALLTWWADMIAKGQFPGPVPGQAPSDSDPTVTAGTKRQTSTRSGSRGWLVGLGLGGVVLAGLAVAFGPTIVEAFADEPAPVPATELMMPATVGADLVAVTGAEVGAQMQALVGIDLRPAGVTVSGAYGTDPAGPLVVAAVATTVPASGDATAELMTWAERSGVPTGEPVPGTGATAGITCAEVTDTETAPPGSKCIWTGTGMNGRTYVVASDPATALERTAEVRSGITAPAAS